MEAIFFTLDDTRSRDPPVGEGGFFSGPFLSPFFS